MGWRTINGRRYYYRCERVNCKVVTIYGGKGLSGEFEELYETTRRILRTQRKAAVEERREADRAFDAMVDGWVEDAKRLAVEFLKERGWHQHKRTWRLKRKVSMKDQSTDIATVSKPDPPASPAKKSAVKRRQRLDMMAASAIATKLLGDTGDDPYQGQRKVIIDDVAEQAERLAGPDPSELEWALCQTAALAWGALRTVEFHINMHLAQRTPEKIKHDDDRIERAQRRYLSILRMLAQIRKVSGPSVLVVNQGQNQQTLIGSGPVQ